MGWRILLCGLVLSFGPLHEGGATGSALRFDGVDDYVNAGEPDVIASGGGNNGLTIAAWIKADDFESDMGRILSKTSGVAEQDHYWMLSTFNSGGIKLRFRLKTSVGGTRTLIASSGNLVPGVWTHVAAVYDGSSMVLYKDGLEVGRASKTGTIAVNNGLAAMIGNNPPTADSRPFDGLIEDVRLLSTGLTAEQVRLQMHLTRGGSEPDMVAYWAFNEGAGATTRDLTGHGFTGILRNGTLWEESTAPLGAGTSCARTVSSPGVVEFPATGLGMNLQVKSGTDQMVVSHLAGTPGGTLPGGLNTLYPVCWVVRRFGPGSFTGSFTFTTGPNTIGSGDQAQPANLKLFRRECNADGAWTEVAAGSSASSSSVTFDGVAQEGQYVVGSAGDSPLPVQLSFFGATPLNDRRVRLEWRTMSEVNNYGFWVERRPHGSPDYALLAGSFVAGAGTTILPQEYAWTDGPMAPGQYDYRLRQTDLDGTVRYADPVQVTVESPTGVPAQGLPASFELGQNYPNPFNPSTRIAFGVREDGPAELRVYNLLGQEVAVLFAGEAHAGTRYEAVLEADALPNGVYLYALTSNGRSLTRKMTLLK
ncbi:MAG: LamG-like jellyroll fold domain-containing protein [Bacteroidota bacterium]